MLPVQEEGEVDGRRTENESIREGVARGADTKNRPSRLHHLRPPPQASSLTWLHSRLWSPCFEFILFLYDASTQVIRLYRCGELYQGEHAATGGYCCGCRDRMRSDVVLGWIHQARSLGVQGLVDFFCSRHARGEVAETRSRDGEEGRSSVRSRHNRRLVLELSVDDECRQSQRQSSRHSSVGSETNGTWHECYSPDPISKHHDFGERSTMRLGFSPFSPPSLHSLLSLASSI